MSLPTGLLAAAPLVPCFARDRRRPGAPASFAAAGRRLVEPWGAHPVGRKAAFGTAIGRTHGNHVGAVNGAPYGIRTRVTALRGPRFSLRLSKAILNISAFIGILSIAVHPFPA